MSTKRVNGNTLARAVTLKEGLKHEQSIAQVKETIRCVCEEFNNYADTEILRFVHQYRKRGLAEQLNGGNE